MYRGFGSGVVCLSGVAAQSDDRRDVDYPAPSCAQHVWDCEFSAVVCAVEVGVECVQPCIVLHSQHQCICDHAGVVDEYLGRSVRVFGCCENLLASIFVGDGSLDSDCGATRAFDLLHDLFGICSVRVVVHSDSVSQSGEPYCNGLADTARRSCDERATWLDCCLVGHCGVANVAESGGRLVGAVEFLKLSLLRFDETHFQCVMRDHYGLLHAFCSCRAVSYDCHAVYA